MTNIRGIVAAMLTPMNRDESINVAELRSQTERMIGAGMHGLFCLGTSGEAYALEEREKIRVIAEVVDRCAGRVPVYAGCGCVTTAETVRLAKAAERIGADVLSVICPYFAVASQEELYRHFMEVADAVHIPVVLYNMPARTGVNLDVDTVGRLSKAGNIAGIKDSSGNFDQILQLIENTADDFAVLSGNDSLVLWTLQAGGKGGICAIANLFPQTMASIYELWRQGEFTKAKEAQDSIRAIRRLLKLGNPNTMVKLTANLIGQPVGPCRKPFWTEDQRLIDEISRVLKEHYGIRVDGKEWGYV
ncbi:MAG: 4-hydroxy-tetrahydrodipicolinate synthase [Clostridia bacterium]|nr:4-hydroxy-tetrahydrodipicolinate synthase [Clostridia bacterium]